MDGPYFVMNQKTANRVSEAINESSQLESGNIFIRSEIAGRPLQNGEVIYVGDFGILKNIIEENVGRGIWHYIRQGQGTDPLQSWDMKERVEESVETIEEFMTDPERGESKEWDDVVLDMEMPFVPFCLYCRERVNVRDAFPVYFEKDGEVRPAHDDCCPFEPYMHCNECGWRNVNPVTTPIDPNSLRCEVCDTSNCTVVLER
jgi:hypothetical protein